MAKDKDKKQRPDPDIEYVGKQITLPADPKKLPLREAADILIRKAEDEEIVMDLQETIAHHPHDALVAFNWAMKKVYGWASPQVKMTFFGPEPPTMVTVKTGPKDAEFEQVPCGVFKLPNIDHKLELHLDFRNNCMHVTSQCRKKDKDVIMELVNLTKDRLRTHSIFRGKALRLPCDSDGDPIFQSIGFIETDYIKPEELILNDDEWDHVQSSLWTPIQKTAQCLKHKIPLKRGVLLEGPFGTGKTMTATVTAKHCVDNGWTYFVLDDVRGLKDALMFAQRYQPCVIFAEDIDRAVELRDERGNDILNTIDGILSKGSKVITVLTTNFVEKLDRAMLRPGRLDAVVSVKVPEPPAVKRLIRLYGAGLVAEDDKLEQSSHSLAGFIPASIREAVERSKLSMIGRGEEKISDHDLHVAAVGMKAHMDLLNSEKPAPSIAERLGTAFQEMIAGGGIEEAMDDAVQRFEHVGGSVASSVAQSAASMKRSVDAGTKITGDRLDKVKADTEAIRARV